MKGKTILSLAVVLAAGACAALKLRGGESDAPAAQPRQPERSAAPEAPTDGDKTVAFPLKNKYTDYSNGEKQPAYIFELETPQGVKELPVTWAHYETYYIGDEVICRETEHGPEVI